MLRLSVFCSAAWLCGLLGSTFACKAAFTCPPVCSRDIYIYIYMYILYINICPRRHAPYFVPAYIPKYFFHETSIICFVFFFPTVFVIFGFGYDGGQHPDPELLTVQC